MNEERTERQEGSEPQIFAVALGRFWFAGAGRTYEGYRKDGRLPIVSGYVFTAVPKFAMRFRSRREAGAVARAIGGRVSRVNVPEKGGKA